VPVQTVLDYLAAGDSIDDFLGGFPTVHERTSLRFSSAPDPAEAGQMKTMDWTKYIDVTPGVRGGKPCLVGTRITPADVLEYLAGGMTEDEVLRDFPSLTRDHIRAVLAYAAERERRYDA
jgi:uncharacterized protein (DUF433 family)